VTADEVERLRQNPDLTVIAGPSQVDNFLSFNSVATPIFGDPKFRQAILYAIDRETIIETLYNGAATPVNCLYGNPKYIPESVAAKYPYDPEQAKALLAEIGFDGAAAGEIELSTYYNDPLSLDVMTAIQDYLAEVGITVTPRQMDSPSWTKLYYDDLAFGASFAGGANGPDPHRAFQYFHSTSTWPKGTNNLSFANADLDAALEAGASEIDPAAREALYQQACEVMSETLPWIFPGSRSATWPSRTSSTPRRPAAAPTTTPPSSGRSRRSTPLGTTDHGRPTTATRALMVVGRPSN
jgi:peptide/nickel transport system substrate-binding protein